MYRVEKVLNHNVILAIKEDNKQEYLIMGKGIGFGKKIAERIEVDDVQVQVYSLIDIKNAKDTTSAVKEINPIYLEAANMLLDEAQKCIGKVDRSVLIPLADHIDFAVRRIKEQGEISNPLTADIQILFHAEFKVAEQILPFLKENSDVSMSENELGYIALHIHSAIAEENVAASMQVTKCVRECINLIEEEIKHRIPIMTLSYNRANAVANFCMNSSNGLSAAEISDLQSLLTVNGRSFSDPIYKSGQGPGSKEVDMDASRRVEIKFRLKEDEMINKITKILEQD